LQIWKYIAEYTEAAVVREMKMKDVHFEIAESIQQLEYKELGEYSSSTHITWPIVGQG
jgi:hypothetical protein